MKPPAKLAAFGVVLVTAIGGGAAVGNVVGPVEDDGDRAPAHNEHEPGADAAGSTGDAQEEMAMPGGVLVSAQGYTLDADETILSPGSDEPFTFSIVGPGGEVVRDFVESHERELHMIVVGSDLGSYAHLHPSRSERGEWSVELPALAPGTYRAFADFAVAGGPELTLGIDLSVSGEARFGELPAVSTRSVVDGYEVTLEGSPVAGSSTEVALTVSRDGRAVTDLEPYLGAFGHLVAIRGGDLAYLHVHPVESGAHGGDGHGSAEAESGGPTVRFVVEVPSPGDYRLFFDFSHGGTVRTAAFTVSVPSTNGGEA